MINDLGSRFNFTSKTFLFSHPLSAPAETQERFPCFSLFSHYDRSPELTVELTELTGLSLIFNLTFF